ncbi:hypothetical protein ACQRIT_005152 [Beauveria bassiana]
MPCPRKEYALWSIILFSSDKRNVGAAEKDFTEICTESGDDPPLATARPERQPHSGAKYVSFSEDEFFSALP